jgi:UDP-N-acetylmuramoyl-L-alanyl-D-glutamate--2,6-diaminopimelate ligase
VLLRELVAGLSIKQIYGSVDISVTDVVHDSREVTPGSLFLALKGAHVDGHDYLEQAFEKGAVAAIVQETRGMEQKGTLLVVEDTDKAMAEIAQAFFGYPARKLRMIGVVGTNGKTTSTYMIKAILESAGRSVGLIGTIKNMIGSEELPAVNTTPNALQLQRLLAKMVNSGVQDVVMEVSSHAIALERIKGIPYELGLFTNITQDHLDFHKTFEAYRQVKASFFHELPLSATAVINQDDPNASFFITGTHAKILTYGLHATAQIYPENVHFELTGIRFTAKTPAGDIPVNIRMTGQFNLFNALGAIGAGLALGADIRTIGRALAEVTVHGRFELVPGSKDFGIVVDYAHTPDGLENVLKAAKNLNPQRLIVIFGCGGDRDRTKRPIMGEIASRYADYAIITSDNPRTESPEGIIDEIEKGIRQGSSYEKVTDRREAIRRGIAMAKSGDFLVIAGKGHETYQIFADRTIHFDDMEVATAALEDKKNGRL